MNFHQGSMREMLFMIKSFLVSSFYWLNLKKYYFLEGNKYQVDLNVDERGKYIRDANNNIV
jgi:hypothetical protein